MSYKGFIGYRFICTRMVHFDTAKMSSSTQVDFLHRWSLKQACVKYVCSQKAKAIKKENVILICLHDFLAGYVYMIANLDD